MENRKKNPKQKLKWTLKIEQRKLLILTQPWDLQLCEFVSVLFFIYFLHVILFFSFLGEDLFSSRPEHGCFFFDSFSFLNVFSKENVIEFVCMCVCVCVFSKCYKLTSKWWTRYWGLVKNCSKATHMLFSSSLLLLFFKCFFFLVYSFVWRGKFVHGKVNNKRKILFMSYVGSFPLRFHFFLSIPLFLFSLSLKREFLKLLDWIIRFAIYPIEFVFLFFLQFSHIFFSWLSSVLATNKLEGERKKKRIYNAVIALM